jgi:hypothetical protein
MKGCFAGRKHVGKPRCRWWDAVSRDIVALPKIRNCGAAETKRQRFRKKFRGCHGPKVPGMSWPKNGLQRLKRRNGCHLLCKIAFESLTVRFLIPNNKCNVLSQHTPITCTLYKIQGAVPCLHAHVLPAYHRMLFVLWHT